jgi:hypothetical protein
LIKEQQPEKYKENFDVSSEGPSLGCQNKATRAVRFQKFYLGSGFGFFRTKKVLKKVLKKVPEEPNFSVPDKGPSLETSKCSLYIFR